MFRQIVHYTHTQIFFFYNFFILNECATQNRLFSLPVVRVPFDRASLLLLLFLPIYFMTINARVINQISKLKHKHSGVGFVILFYVIFRVVAPFRRHGDAASVMYTIMAINIHQRNMPAVQNDWDRTLLNTIGQISNFHFYYFVVNVMISLKFFWYFSVILLRIYNFIENSFAKFQKNDLLKCFENIQNAVFPVQNPQRTNTMCVCVCKWEGIS